MEMIQVVLVGLCCTTLKDQLRRVVNVSAFRLIQYRKSKTKVLIFANQSAGEYHQDQWELKGSKTRLNNSLLILVWIWLIEKVARNFQTNHIGVRQNQSVAGLLLTFNTFAKLSVTTFVFTPLPYGPKIVKLFFCEICIVNLPPRFLYWFPWAYEMVNLLFSIIVICHVREADESSYFETKRVGKNWPWKWVIILCEYPWDNSPLDIPKSLTSKELNPGFILSRCLKLALV